jgi:hypothetical protein
MISSDSGAASHPYLPACPSMYAILRGLEGLGKERVANYFCTKVSNK